MPRIHVFDTSVPSGTVTNLPLVGSFDLSTYPTCHQDMYTSECYRPMMNISADGKTLFIAGSVKLVVAPVPDALSALKATRSAKAMKEWK